MGTSLPSISTCQKVHPLQAGAPLYLGAHLVDGPAIVRGHDGAVCTDLCGMAPFGAVELLARAQQAAFDQPAEWNARLFAFRRCFEQIRFGNAARVSDAPGRQLDVVRVAFDPDKITAELFGHGACGPAAEKRIEDQVPDLCRGEHHTVQQRFGLLGRVRLLPSSFFRRSPPLQIGSNQSLRIWRSSFSAFMAS